MINAILTHVASTVAPKANNKLPPLPVWRAKSFWLAVISTLAPALGALGVDLGPATIEYLATILPLVLAAVQRMAPSYRLTWR